MKSKIFCVSFFYFLYIVFLGHHLLGSDATQVLEHYSKVGFYFASLIIAYNLVLGWQGKPSNFVFINEARQWSKSNTAYIVMMSLVASHLFAHWAVMDEVASWLSHALHLNYHLLNWVIGFSIFLLGCYLMRYVDKKLMLFLVMMLFVHGFYHVVLWSSLHEQKQIYVRLYSLMLRKEVLPVQCGKEFNCIALPLKDMLKPVEVDASVEMREKINNYFKEFHQRIKDSPDEIVDFSYGDSLVTFVDDEYQPIGVYWKSKERMILDYKSAREITRLTYKTYHKLTGIAMICWMSFIHLLLVFHFALKLHYNKPPTPAKQEQQ